MPVVDLIARVKSSAKTRTKSERRSLLISAHILDEKTGSYDARFFSKSTVESSVAKSPRKTLKIAF